MEAITWNPDECLHGEHGCTALAEEVPIHCISLKKSKASCKLKSTTVPAPFAPSPAANALASARKLSKSYPYSPRISSLKSIGYTYGCMHVCVCVCVCTRVRTCMRACVFLENRAEHPERGKPLAVVSVCTARACPRAALPENVVQCPVLSLESAWAPVHDATILSPSPGTL